MQVTLAGDIAIGNIGDHPEGEKEETNLWIPQME
jgi:hypothetical protein